MIKSRGMGLEETVARMGKRKISAKYWWEKQKEGKTKTYMGG
jgi:hypothetical protein